MPGDLSKLNTIVVVMMENRSFDHLLGYLALDPYNRLNVEGVVNDPEWQEKFANPDGTFRYPVFHLDDPFDPIDADPPHERDQIALQMGIPVNDAFPMDGFVRNYASAKGAAVLAAASRPPVMGYFAAHEAPVTDFFAQKFAICDHWFSAIPAGTQPNRLMAMSGFTMIDVNQTPFLPDQELVYDWLTRRGVRWRVYHEGLPFFAMMPRWLPDILAEVHFRPFERLFEDVQNEPPNEFPQVIFIEPTYTDAPHIAQSSDDHAPSAIKNGQAFLLEVYRCMTQVPDIWNGTVMIVTYDEHGGFFDHVSPPAIRTDPPIGAHYQDGFQTLGVRVPAFVISPFVAPGIVHNGVFDHTSILKLIGQRFGEGNGYSNEVDARPVVGSVRDVLDSPVTPREAPAIPSLAEYLQRESAHAGFLPSAPGPETTMQHAFQYALDAIRVHPDRPSGKFDQLLTQFPPATPVA